MNPEKRLIQPEELSTPVCGVVEKQFSYELEIRNFLNRGPMASSIFHKVSESNRVLVKKKKKNVDSQVPLQTH